MKKIILASAFTFCLSVVLFAQQSARTEFEVIKDVFKTEKKALVADFLQLTDAESAKFWPIYDKYEAERNSIANARFENISSYAKNYDSLTDAQADALIKKAMDIQARESALKKKYYDIVKKSVGTKRAAGFVQLEEYISSAVKSELYEQLPLVPQK